MTPTTRLLLATALGALNLSLAACVSAQDAVPTEAAAPAGRTADRLPPKPVFEELLGAFDVPGMALATLTGCEPDGVTAVGSANLQTSEPVTANTAFEAASLTKPLFAYLVLQLADEGVIDLDQPLPPFPAPRVEDREAFAKVTPRMILTHRTGMPNWAGDSQDEDRTDAISFESEPGEAYSYSGEAFEILRAYVEAKSGRTFQELFEDRLGAAMPNSSVDGTLRGQATSSRGYVSASDGSSSRSLYLTPHRTGAAWGLVTTAGDYARFLDEVCRGEGLSEAMQADMLRPQAPLPQGMMPGPASYGLGWVMLQLGPDEIAMHTGNNDEYRSLAAFLPATGEGYVILTNGRNGEDMISAIMEQAQP
ncbi:serine hydrolase domain-containing protein [Parvularcula maris]|uniref:Beta-lactamase family protein n=1 Tax=Parvularcula maris TaxID=2965077 RepID=A0A9X2LB83_9PROT|nr:serine hydrolase domain-containing protein [Parvularcula maris]MCQ8186477.1 beta-lactamase family protein [Parvularcula maris]